MIKDLPKGTTQYLDEDGNLVGGLSPEDIEKFKALLMNAPLETPRGKMSEAKPMTVDNITQGTSLKDRIIAIKNHMKECNYEQTPESTYPLDLTYSDVTLLEDYFVSRLDS